MLLGDLVKAGRMVTKQFSIFQMYQKMDMPVAKLMFENRNVAAFYLEPMVQIPLSSKQIMANSQRVHPKPKFPERVHPELKGTRSFSMTFAGNEWGKERLYLIWPLFESACSSIKLKCSDTDIANISGLIN